MTIELHLDPLDAGHDLLASGASARLRDAHLEASECIGLLDLGDARLWKRAGPSVTAVSRAAYELSASLRGGIPVRVATGVPPVVRARELASAQTCLFEDLERYPGVPWEVLEASAADVARLVRMIRDCRARPSG